MNKQYADISSEGRTAPARACATKAVLAACIFSFIGAAPAAFAQTAPATGSPPPAVAGAAGAGAAGAAGMSLGTLAAIGAGVTTVAQVAGGAASGSASAASNPSGNGAAFTALVSAGAIQPDKSGAYTIPPLISPAQMAMMLALAWNAIQAVELNVHQMLAAVANEQALDQYPSQDKPTDDLTLAQLQRQLAEDLKLQLANEKKKSLRNQSKEFDEEIQQYIQNAVANDVQRQKQFDSASGTSGFPYIAAGFVTPQSSYPTNLTATYNGTVTGALSNATPINGTISMTVNFANLGSIPGSINFANGQGTANFALTGAGASIGGQMSGTYAGQSINAGSFISGQFYGPAANEAGGNWNLNTASNTGSGQFAAKR